MKAFIIRLADIAHSCKIANECVEQAAKFNLTVEYFNGILGNDADAVFANDGITKYPKSLKKDTAGVKGCAASHYLLWKQCADGNEPYLILEQDGYMIRPLPELDFQDVLKLDSCNPFSETYNQDVAVDLGSQIIDYDLNWGYKKKAAPYGGYFRGAWAYIIKPHAAKILVDAVKENGWVPADKQIGENLLNLKTVSSTVFRIHPEYTHTNIETLSLTRTL